MWKDFLECDFTGIKHTLKVSVVNILWKKIFLISIFYTILSFNSCILLWKHLNSLTGQTLHRKQY